MKTPTFYSRGIYSYLATMAIVFLLPEIALCCVIPKEYDVKEVVYDLERIDSSIKVRIAVPQLSLVACDEEKVAFGTLWTFALTATNPIVVQAVDRNGNTVQERKLTGSLQLKATSSWTSLNLFSLQWDKRLTDQDFTKVELWSTSTLFPAPAVELTDQGRSRRLPATVTNW